MDEWMPIETAPKDGSTILAFEPGYGLGDGKGVIATVHWLNADWSEACWACPLDLGKVFDLPTHWMPLPTPPAA